MNKEKKFDCIKFKNELQQNAWKNSGANNLREYVEYINAAAKNSVLYKGSKNNQKSANVI